MRKGGLAGALFQKSRFRHNPTIPQSPSFFPRRPSWESKRRPPDPKRSTEKVYAVEGSLSLAKKCATTASLSLQLICWQEYIFGIRLTWPSSLRQKENIFVKFWRNLSTSLGKMRLFVAHYEQQSAWMVQNSDKNCNVLRHSETRIVSLCGPPKMMNKKIFIPEIGVHTTESKAPRSLKWHLSAPASQATPTLGGLARRADLRRSYFKNHSNNAKLQEILNPKKRTFCHDIHWTCWTFLTESAIFIIKNMVRMQFFGIELAVQSGR